MGINSFHFLLLAFILKRTKTYFYFIPFCVLFIVACKPSVSSKLENYTRSTEGYYYRLVQIGELGLPPKSKAYYHIQTSFKTWNDSVFWDSRHEGNNRLFIKSGVTSNLLHRYVQQLNAGDSAELCIPTRLFFEQQFASKRIPYFCEKDSFVKISLKIKQVMGFEDWALTINTFKSNEDSLIESFVTKTPESYKDSMGIVWQKGQPQTDQLIGNGQLITFSFQGAFLDGRMVDAQPQTLVYKLGTPDQVLNGINYVIKRLKKGETSKIILPSHLAFGERGSSNGSIPPFTPLAYTLTLIDVKY